jgi:bacillithiol biosynthesis cysteine-adding enzyme BshC
MNPQPSRARLNLQPLAVAPLRDAGARFLAEHPAGAPLYPAGSPSDPGALTRRARKLEAWPGDRAALAAWLKTQNAFAPLEPAQKKNLEDAGKPEALFVLTGQQPGLLGGPSLALHKALTAVAHARDAAKALGRPVIPVFWAAGDDSDLAESNAAEFLEPGARTSGLSLEFENPDEAVPMSLRVLSEEAAQRVREALPAEWPEEVRAIATEAYAPGRSLTEAFLRVMQPLLGPEGVLFVDGLYASLHNKSAQNVLARVTRSAAEFHAAVDRGTRRLRETLNQPPQVPVRPGTVPVFLFEDGRRARLFLSDSGRVYTAGREERDLREAPDLRLLHSALTRPLVVEALFPALAHVLGPAELRYFAQIADVFPAFDLSMPLLAPRQQAVALRRAAWGEFEALGFHPEELFDLRPTLVRERLTERAWKGHPAARAFPDDAHRALEDSLKAYQGRWFPGADFSSPLRRLGRAFGNYRERARRRVFEQSASEAFRALQPLLRWLGNGAQDRHLNTLSLRAALGAEGFAGLKRELSDAGASAHALAWTEEGEQGGLS